MHCSPTPKPAGWPWRTCVAAALAALIFLVAGPAPGLFIYSPDRLAAGELWRLITCHFTHVDGPHLAWNVGALLILGLLYERRLGKGFWGCLLAGIAAIDIWMVCWSELDAYCGLSGVLNTILVAGLAAEWQRYRSRLALLGGFGALAKIVVETATGSALFTSTAWPSVPPAHMAGFAAGLAFAALPRLRGKAEPALSC